MAASFLRLGGLSSLKCVLMGSRGTLSRVPAAAFCIKPGDPKKPAKKTSVKKAKTSVDVGQFLQQRTHVDFPKKEPWGVPESRAEAAAKYAAAFQATAPSAEASVAPSADAVLPVGDPIVELILSTEAEAPQPVLEVTPPTAVSEAVAEAVTTVEATAAAEASTEDIVVAQAATEEVPQVVVVEAVAEPIVAEAVLEATPDVIVAEAVLEATPDVTVAEAVLDGAAEIVPEAVEEVAASASDSPVETISELTQDTATTETASEPILQDTLAEAVPEAMQEASVSEALLEPVAEGVGAEALPETIQEASIAEAPLKPLAEGVVAEALPEMIQEAAIAEAPLKPLAEGVVAEAVSETTQEVAIAEVPLEPVAEGVSEAACEGPANVEEVTPTAAVAETVPEPVTATTEAVVEAAEAVSSEESVDPAPVLAEAPEAVESSQADPIQKLFIDKIREYSAKSKSTGGLVDTGPEYERNLAEEVNRLQRLYGGGDLDSFPEFKFTEPKLEEVSPK